MFVGARSRFRMSFRGSIRRAFAAGRQGSHRPGQRPRGAAGLPPLLSGARVSLPSAYSIRRSFSSLRLRGASVPVCASAPASPQVRAPPRSPSSLYPRADRSATFVSRGPTQKTQRGRARAERSVHRTDDLLFQFQPKSSPCHLSLTRLYRKKPRTFSPCYRERAIILFSLSLRVRQFVPRAKTSDEEARCW